MFQYAGSRRVEERERRVEEQGDQLSGKECQDQRRSQEQGHFVGGQEPGKFEALNDRRLVRPRAGSVRGRAQDVRRPVRASIARPCNAQFKLIAFL